MSKKNLFSHNTDKTEHNYNAGKASLIEPNIVLAPKKNKDDKYRFIQVYKGRTFYKIHDSLEEAQKTKDQFEKFIQDDRKLEEVIDLYSSYRSKDKASSPNLYNVYSDIVQLIKQPQISNTEKNELLRCIEESKTTVNTAMINQLNLFNNLDDEKDLEKNFKEENLKIVKSQKQILKNGMKFKRNSAKKRIYKRLINKLQQHVDLL
tara:strand:- start:956 stop:1573 length:618 start_codon:yes stop_codon:yes gene_type:complete